MGRPGAVVRVEVCRGRARRPAWLMAAALSCGIVVACAVPAAAQTMTRRPSARPRTIGVRAYVAFDVNALSASQTFDAVLGTARLNAVGGGGELLGIWKGLFLRVAASTMRREGSRVVIDTDGRDVVPLGIPVTVEMRPVEFGAGWRATLGRRRIVSVYGGAGLLHLVYRETSRFARVDEDTDTTFNGSVIFGGVEVPVWRWIVAGAEGQIRSVPNAIGAGGASKVFKETDLGGGTLRVVLGVRF